MSSTRPSTIRGVRSGDLPTAGVATMAAPAATVTMATMGTMVTLGMVGTLIVALLAGPVGAAPPTPPDAGTGSPCSVALIEPREGKILYGMVDLFAEVECPESTSPGRVQFLADGEVVAEGTRAPYRAIQKSPLPASRNGAPCE